MQRNSSPNGRARLLMSLFIDVAATLLSEDIWPRPPHLGEKGHDLACDGGAREAPRHSQTRGARPGETPQRPKTYDEDIITTRPYRDDDAR